MNDTFQAHGKLLLTAEYFVLDGALALALPVRLGQTLQLDFAENHSSFIIHHSSFNWRSHDADGSRWFEADFDIENFEFQNATDPAVATRLQQILQTARQLNPNFLPPSLVGANCQLPTVNCQLTFPRTWGLGTSSTLISLVAQWAGVDTLELQFRTFGGSGYDVACAGAEGPILYLLKERAPQVEPCNFHPTFSNCLYFIYLGQKQDSREGIKRYRDNLSRNLGIGKLRNRRFTSVNWDIEKMIAEVSDLTREFLQAKTLAAFQKLMRQHETLVSDFIGLPKVQDVHFPDFQGAVKSLGAWGGDFVLAASDRPTEEVRQYFNEKRFGVFLPFDQLAL